MKCRFCPFSLFSWPVVLDEGSQPRALLLRTRHTQSLSPPAKEISTRGCFEQALEKHEKITVNPGLTRFASLGAAECKDGGAVCFEERRGYRNSIGPWDFCQ